MSLASALLNNMGLESWICVASVGLCMVILQRTDMVEGSVVAIRRPVHCVGLCFFPVFESIYAPLGAVAVQVYD